MYSFKNDYNQLGHKNIINRLNEIADNQYGGYGLDDISIQAKNKIRRMLGCNADIHFLVGGTQSNMIVISSILKPYQGVISADSGHINVHETGAIEHTGHKVLSLASKDGKLTSAMIENCLKEHYDDANAEHTVMPKMVYISNPTELGTIYSKKELMEIHEVCKEYGMPLFMDGARLAYLFDARGNDVYFKDLKDLVDVYYIGGTKCGAMLGEAVVFNDLSLSENFRYNIKQGGGLLAKGYLLGVQFDELFTDDLYLSLGKYGNKLADQLDVGLKALKVKMFVERYSNQIFPILDNRVIEKLKEKYAFEFWGKIDETSSCIRLVVSWATDQKMIEAFLKDLKELI